MTTVRAAMPEAELFLGGRLKLLQPAEGYRAAIDPLFLAAAVPASPGERALDLGCGVGTAALALLARVPDVICDGLEIDPELARLAAENARLNAVETRFTVLTGDVLRPPAALVAAGYDQVLCNPPYLERARADPPADLRRRRAEVEGEARLVDWLGAALHFVRPGGHITFVQRADRLPELLGLLGEGAGAGEIFPLWPGRNKAARRVIVRARRSARGPARLLPGLVLHESDGSYTAAADVILRQGAALEFPAR